MSGVLTIDEIAKKSKWQTTIGTICDRFGGEVQTGPFGSQLHASDYVDDGIPVVMPQDMVEGKITSDRIARTSPNDVERLQQHALRRGDIVYSRRGDVSRFAVVTDREEGWLCGTGSIRIRLNCPDIDIVYARHFLKQDAVRKWLFHQAKGVTMPNLNTSIIRALPFVCPPIEEQRRIAAILDAADGLRAKRRAALAKLDQLAQSIFIEMFGDPATDPMRWPLVTIGNLVSSANYGTSEKAGAEGEWPILRMNNITYDGRINLRNLKYLDLMPNEIEKYTVRSGDILFNRTNSPDLVGKTAVFRDPEPMAFAGYLVRLRCNAEAVPDYISAVLNSRFGKAKLRTMCKSIIGMANINAKEVQGIMIPKPPVPLQETFASQLKKLEIVRSNFLLTSSQADVLFASLQHRAFRGEL
jgi:type I restriction enzyme, S subunit